MEIDLDEIYVHKFTFHKHSLIRIEDPMTSESTMGKSNIVSNDPSYVIAPMMVEIRRSEPRDLIAGYGPALYHQTNCKLQFVWIISIYLLCKAYNQSKQ